MRNGKVIVILAAALLVVGMGCPTATVTLTNNDSVDSVLFFFIFESDTTDGYGENRSPAFMAPGQSVSVNVSPGTYDLFVTDSAFQSGTLRDVTLEADQNLQVSWAGDGLTTP